MADEVEAFFERLRSVEGSPGLAAATGTLLLELTSGRSIDRWLVSVDRGEVRVAHGNGEADSVVTMERSLFEGMIQGRVNAMAATLRGLIVAHGNTNMFVKFQRLFPGPPPKRRSRPRATTGGRP